MPVSMRLQRGPAPWPAHLPKIGEGPPPPTKDELRQEAFDRFVADVTLEVALSKPASAPRRAKPAKRSAVDEDALWVQIGRDRARQLIAEAEAYAEAARFRRAAFRGKKW